MPLTVRCACGKIFKVKDELAGSLVHCQVCQAPILVGPAEEEPALSLPALPAKGTAPSPGSPSKVCPSCAEQVPIAAITCPFCHEECHAQLAPEQAAQLIRSLVQDLDEHLGNPQEMMEQRAILGSLLTMKTLILGVIEAGFVLLGISGIFSAKDGGGFIALGVIFGILFGIPLLVSFVHDLQSHNIQAGKGPAQVFRRYFMALQTRRTNRAYAALVPKGRKFGPVDGIRFREIPGEPLRFTVFDLDDFKRYWKNVFRGPSLHSRLVNLKKVEEIRATPDGVAVISAEIEFTSYPTLLALTIPLGLLVTLILILLVQKKETHRIRKLLVRRKGRWFVAHGEFQGLMDGIGL